MNAPLDSIHANRTPNRGPHDEAAGELRQQAIENLTERLKDGKRVGRCDVWDLLDSELDSNYRARLEDIGAILLSNGNRDELADRMLDGLIERYLDTHSDLIEEEADEIEHAAAEDVEL